MSTIKNPHRSQFKNGLGEVVDENEIEFHDFKYYMGEPVHIVDEYKDTDVLTDIAKNIIMNFIKDAIEKHKTVQSQWAVDEEFEDGTKEYRVTLKHFYGDLPLSNMMKDKKVLPFNPKNKLYQVPDTDGTLHYVKASFGGERILDAELDSAIWEAEENEFYKLEGTGEIIGGEEIDLTKGLVAHFEFEGNTNDSSDNANDGIEYGDIEYVNGVIGKAAIFDGIDDYMLGIDGLSRLVENTHSFWIKTGNELEQNAVFLQTSNLYMQFRGNNITIAIFQDRNGGGDSDVATAYNFYVSPILIINDAWNHVSINTYADNTLSLTINGILVNVNSIEDHGVMGNYNSLVIGASYNSEQNKVSNYSKMQIDDFRIYNHALGMKEIQKLYDLR